MANLSETPMPVFQLAKQLNISHKDIVTFLETIGINATINTRLEPDIQQKVYNHFDHDVKQVDQLRHEKEKMRAAAEEVKKQQDEMKRSEEEARLKAEVYRMNKLREAQETERLEAEQRKKEAELRKKAEEEQKKAREELKQRRKAEEEAQKLLEAEVKKDDGSDDKRALRKKDKSKILKKINDTEVGAVVSSEQVAAKTTQKEVVSDDEEAKKKDKKTRKKRKHRAASAGDEADYEKKLDDLKKRHRGATKRFQVSEVESRLDSFRKKKLKADEPVEVVDAAGKKKGHKVDQVEVDQSIKHTLAAMDDRKARRKHYKKQSAAGEFEQEESNIIEVTEFISVEELARHLDVNYTEIISKCLQMGKIVTINQRLDWDTIELLASEFGHEAVKLKEYIDESMEEDEDLEEDVFITRAPVVTVMGHVDHGKTSILDFIRKTRVVDGESGGITQHIGAYRVFVKNNQAITFLDTPGHEAFTAMRARGAQITDIVVIVVAADDGVMPQTKEAINHAQAAGVPMIIAINKMDKPGVEPERIIRELSENNVLVESWGGSIQNVMVSAKTGLGIDALLDSILLETEMLDLKAPEIGPCRGVVVEARLDKGLGPVATILIQRGTLRIGDPFLCGRFSGRIRAMMNERGERLTVAKPSDPVQIQGFDDVPQAGDHFITMNDEREVRRIATERQRLHREQEFRSQTLQTLDQISQQIIDGKTKELNLIIKGDADGSIEAFTDSFMKLSTKEVAVKVIHKGIGMIVRSDINLASASNAVIIGFHVNTNVEAKDLAKQLHVEIRNYTIIYDAVEDVRLALEGMLDPEKVKEILGTLEIRQIIKVPKIGKIGGSYVTSGKVMRNSQIRITRAGTEIFNGYLTQLKRFKDDVKEVKEGLECGILIDGFDDYEIGDMVESFIEKSIKRKLLS